jgi:hypothetical protein
VGNLSAWLVDAQSLSASSRAYRVQAQMPAPGCSVAELLLVVPDRVDECGELSRRLEVGEMPLAG